MALQQGLVTITGRVGSTPQGHGHSSPPSICTFRLGCTRGYYDANRQWRSLPTTWLTVKTFRALAANVHASVRTGDPVIVTGVLATEEWAAENGEKRSRVVIEASNVGHDLNYGMTRLNANRRDDGGGAAASGCGAGGGDNGGRNADAGAGGAAMDAGAVADGIAATDVTAGGDGNVGGSAQVGSAASADAAGDAAPGSVAGRQYTDGFAQPVQASSGADGEIPPPAEPPGDEFGSGAF